tara:strand:- start:30 stop:590 length:561 start_codon:yes stop_codon:yes gene_type:complete
MFPIHALLAAAGVAGNQTAFSGWPVVGGAAAANSGPGPSWDQQWGGLLPFHSNTTSNNTPSQSRPSVNDGTIPPEAITPTTGSSLFNPIVGAIRDIASGTPPAPFSGSLPPIPAPEPDTTTQTNTTPEGTTTVQPMSEANWYASFPRGTQGVATQRGLTGRRKSKYGKSFRRGDIGNSLTTSSLNI